MLVPPFHWHPLIPISCLESVTLHIENTIRQLRHGAAMILFFREVQTLWMALMLSLRPLALANANSDIAFIATYQETTQNRPNGKGKKQNTELFSQILPFRHGTGTQTHLQIFVQFCRPGFYILFDSYFDILSVTNRSSPFFFPFSVSPPFHLFSLFSSFTYHLVRA